MAQRLGETDRAMATHAQEADIVEEDHASERLGPRRWQEQRADQRIEATRLVAHGGAEAVVELAEHTRALRRRAGSEVGCAGEDNARRLTFGVRIDDSDPLHGRELARAQVARVESERSTNVHGLRTSLRYSTVTCGP